MRIVLIEDSPTDVRLFREALRSSGLEVTVDHFPDGASAVASIRGASEPGTPTPDLVFLDLTLPRLDGFAVLETIRRTPQYVHVPVAIFTSSGSLVHKNKALKLGADRVVVKPTTLRDFFEAVTSTVRELVTFD